MEFKEVVLSRYAARGFKDERIPDAVIQELLELVRWTPSGLNVQPWRIRVIEDQPTKSALAQAAWGQAHVGNCSHLLVLCAENDLEGQLGRLDQAFVAAGVSEADRGRIMSFTRGVFAKVPEESLPEFMRNQVFIALGTALLAAKSLGIDSCPVTGFDAGQVATILGLPPHIIPTALCPLGYSGEAPRARVRFPVSQILI